MDNAETLVQQFSQICNGKSTTAIKEAETNLLELEKDPNFLSLCMAIFTESQVQCNPRVI